MPGFGAGVHTGELHEEENRSRRQLIKMAGMGKHKDRTD